LAGAFLLAFAADERGAREPDEAQRVEYTERVEVRLVILDVVVLDKNDHAVVGLNRDDFEIIVGANAIPIETLDVDCRGGPPSAERGRGRPAPGTSPPQPSIPPQEVAHLPQEITAPPPEDAAPRRIVLALDYQHLARTRRFQVLERVISMMRSGAASGDEIMVVALNGGLRIEQRFTRDPDRLVASLERMQYDLSLWQPEFFHLNESGFVGGMTAMLEFLGAVPGPKAVVLFSEMGHVPLEDQFREIAAVAAAARCAIYPVDVGGLAPGDPAQYGFTVRPNTVSARKTSGKAGGPAAPG